MANLTLTTTWETGIYEFALTDPVQGGPGGIDNLPTRQLGNRTEYLKANLDALIAGTVLPAGVATQTWVTGRAASTNPLANGAAAPGTATTFARGDHVHPTDTTRQAALGYTPVQQGTGIGQSNNSVKIGWGSGKLRVTIDNTDVGPIALESWVTDTIASAATSKANTTGTYAGLSVGYATTAGNTDTLSGATLSQVRDWNNLTNKPADLVYANGGTYGLNITGNAATASSATIATTADSLTGLTVTPGSSYRLPGGHVEKWGTYYIGDITGGTHLYTITFPVAFPTVCDNVQLTLQDTAAGPAVAVDFRLVTVSQGSFTAQVLEHGDATQNLTLHWTAKGR